MSFALSQSSSSLGPSDWDGRVRVLTAESIYARRRPCTQVADANGRVGGMAAVGMVMYTVIVLTVNLQLAHVLNYWNSITVASLAVTFALWFVFVLVYGASISPLTRVVCGGCCRWEP